MSIPGSVKTGFFEKGLRLGVAKVGGSGVSKEVLVSET